MPRLNLPTNRTRAPEFPGDFAWVNTDRPLGIRTALKGRVVILDFWTYCCINCMHVLPDLEYLEHKYAGQPFAVVGVHSAKFDNEGDKQNIQTACARYQIAHPVIVDEKHAIWSEYGVRSWPTLVIIDSEGKIVGTVSGEGNREILDNIVHTLLEEGREKGTLASGPPEFKKQGRVPSASGLAFPGKVLAESSGQWLFISDSNHNRIIQTDTSGNVIAIIGNGKRGHADGSCDKAEFANPQGLAFDNANQLLYVADTDNHLIRKINLQEKSVATICGTGAQVYDRVGGGVGHAQGLNSPWDVALDGNTLYIAMAGPHQLWLLDLTTLRAQAWVGSGMEDIDDGEGLSAALAQPSGLAQKDDWLYFADSEVSAVRKVNVKTRTVETLIGHGLFDFGDRTGALDRALLQHPLGVAVYGEDIIVADTYNHKIKRISEANGNITTVAGNGTPTVLASDHGELSLYEPGGVSVRGDLLYIADTNHDRVIEYHLQTSVWKEFQLKGLNTLATQQMDVSAVSVQEIAIATGREVTLRLSADFANGIHLNKEAPINYAFMPAIKNGHAAKEGLASAHTFPIEVTIPSSDIEAGKEYIASLSIAYCTDGNQSLCIPTTLAWRVKFVNGAGDNRVELKSTVKPML